MKKKAIITLLNLLVFTMYSQAQTVQQPAPSDDTHVTSNRTVTFRNTSSTKEIKIYVEKSTKRFDLNIRSMVEKGSLGIEVFDPSGVKHENYSIGTQLGSDAKENVMGSIRKSLNQPQEGIWIIKITSKSATGDVRINTSFID